MRTKVQTADVRCRENGGITTVFSVRFGRACGATLPMPYPVSKATFAALVEQALAELPEPFASFLEQVPVEIKDRPTRKQLRSAGLQDDELLLGLYLGHPQTHRSVLD